MCASLERKRKVAFNAARVVLGFSLNPKKKILFCVVIDKRRKTIADAGKNKLTRAVTDVSVGGIMSELRTET